MMSLAAVLDALEVAGVVRLSITPGDQKASVVLRWQAPAGAVSKQLQRTLRFRQLGLLRQMEAAGLTVCTIPELRRLVGIIPRDGYHAQTTIGQRREELIARYEALTGELLTETLALEELADLVAELEQPAALATAAAV